MKLGLIFMFVVVTALGCGASGQKTADRAGQDIENGAKQTKHDVETLGPGHGDAGDINSH